MPIAPVFEERTNSVLHSGNQALIFQACCLGVKYRGNAADGEEGTCCVPCTCGSLLPFAACSADEHINCLWLDFQRGGCFLRLPLVTHICDGCRLRYDSRPAVYVCRGLCICVCVILASAKTTCLKIG